MKSYVEIILSVKLARLNYIPLPRESAKYFTCSPLLNRRYRTVEVNGSACYLFDPLESMKKLFGL